MRGVPETPGAGKELKKAHWLAWLSIAYLISTVAMLFMVMG